MKANAPHCTSASLTKAPQGSFERNEFWELFDEVDKSDGWHVFMGDNGGSAFVCIFRPSRSADINKK